VKVIGITQARVGSTRLPNKVLLSINNITLLEYHLNRLIISRNVNKWIVATTHELGSDQIVNIAKAKNIDCFKGHTEDVLNRFYEAVRFDDPDYVVRVTSDCPLIDADLIDKIVQFAVENELDYFQTSENYPDGFDVEVFKFSELENANSNSTLKSDREHVTPFIRNRAISKGRLITYECPSDFSKIRLTVDEKKDFDTIKYLINHLGANLSWLAYTEFVVNNLEHFNNQSIIRNEGYLISINKD
jgi:spore coat polysaccharide biosynthesis protein SpsF (cytidylyltransferase family)